MAKAKRIQKPKIVDFSTTLSKEAKEALTLFCAQRGLKMNRFLEDLIWDRLEEEMDAELAAVTDQTDLVDLKVVARAAKR